MKILLSGGTGFIGNALLKRLVEEKHRVILLTRHPGSVRDLPRDLVEVEQWDGKTPGSWADCIEEVDGVVNLAGESIGAKRWTNTRKQLIITSRVEPTKAIVAAMAAAKKKPAVLVNASAVGYYGNVESGDVIESHPRGNDFLADLCERWEQEARAAEKLGVRVVMLRTGIVLEKDGGALKKFLLPFKFFVGGPLGSGQQWLPWVHRDDVVRAMIFALQNPSLWGPVNLAAPDTVTMEGFCSALGRAMGRPSWAPVPAILLRLLLGEMAGMVLTGQRVIPKKLEEAGYTFLHPKLDEALTAVLRK